MLLNLPDDIVRRAEASATDLRVALAIQLYVDNRIDYTDACRLAGQSADEMSRELIGRGIGVQQYPTDSLERRHAGSARPA